MSADRARTVEEVAAVICRQRALVATEGSALGWEGDVDDSAHLAGYGTCGDCISIAAAVVDEPGITVLVQT